MEPWLLVQALGVLPDVGWNTTPPPDLAPALQTS